MVKPSLKHNTTKFNLHFLLGIVYSNHNSKMNACWNDSVMERTLNDVMKCVPVLKVDHSCSPVDTSWHERREFWAGFESR